MTKNKIQDLRDHLFDTIEMLKKDDPKMTVDKAKTIADVSQVIINSAKLEIDFIKVKDKLDGFYPTTGFMEIDNKKQITQ
jgi:hypothetical protein